MPVRYDDERRHSSYVRPTDVRYSTTFESVYDGSDDSEQYRSTPALNQHAEATGDGRYGNYDRLRFGGSQEAISVRSESVDSLDNSSRRSDHSRQSSGDGASSTSSRTAPHYRRVAQSVIGPKAPGNAMQFVAVGRQNPLAEKAKEVVGVMDKQKKEKKLIQSGEDDWQSKARMPEDDNGGDWVSNLSAWKNKMRRKSTNTYVRAIEADEISKEKEEDVAVKGRRNKTFKEMMAEKSRRKSSSFNIYPYGEEGAANSAKPTDPEPAPVKEVHMPVKSDDVDQFGFLRRKQAEDTKESKLSKLRSGVITNMDNNNTHKADDKFSKWKTLEKDKKQQQNQQPPPRQQLRNKPWQTPDTKLSEPKENSRTFNNNNDVTTKWKSSQESVNVEDNFSKWRKREKSGDIDFKRETSPDFKSEIPKQDRFSRWRKSEKAEEQDEDVFKQPEVPPVPRASLRTYPTEEKDIAPWARSSPEPERKTFSSGLYKTKSNLEGENEADDVTNNYRHQASSQVPLSSSDRWRSINNAKTNETPLTDSISMQISLPSPSNQSIMHPEQEVNTAAQPGNRRWEQRASERAAAKRRDANVDPPQISDLQENSRPEHEQLGSSQGGRYESENMPRVGHDDNKRTFVEKSVHVNAQAGRSFGFTIKGGKEDGTPISIERVSLGSPADVCELLAGDEIVSINSVEVGQHYKESVMAVIQHAVQSGQLDLRIRHYVSADAGDEFDEDSDEEDSFDEIPQHQDITPKPMSQESFQDEQGDEEADVEAMEEEVQQDEEWELGEAPVSPPESVQTSSMAPGDSPPPIPSEPPPAPNWNTFPASNESADDFEDVLPDISESPNLNKPQLSPLYTERDSLSKRHSMALDQLESSRRIKVAALRRRSEYLGVNVEDMEEFHKLQDEVEQEAERIAEREEEDRRLLEQGRQRRSLADERDRKDENSLLKQIDRIHITSAADIRSKDFLIDQDDEKTISATSFGTGTYSYKPEYDLEQAERQIIENLEREEQSKVSPTWRDTANISTANGRNHLKGWKSSDKLTSDSDKMSYGMNDIEARALHDMATTFESQSLDDAKPVRSSMRFFDFEADQKRMEEWGNENDRRNRPDDRHTSKGDAQVSLQEQFERGQEEMRRRYEEEKRQTDAIMEQKRQKEEVLLEKERVHQQQLEVMRQQQEEERQRRRAQEEVRRRREEQEQEAQRRKEEAEQERIRLLEEQKERERQREAKRDTEKEAQRQRELEHEAQRQETERLHQEADIQKKLKRQQIHVDRDTNLAGKPHGEYTFTFSVNNNKKQTAETRKATTYQEHRLRDEGPRVEDRATLEAQHERTRQFDTERQYREEQELRQQKREERIQQEAVDMKAQRSSQQHSSQGWSGHENQQRGYQSSSAPDLNRGYPYRPQEAPVSQLNNYTKPLQVDTGYSDSRKMNNNNNSNEYSRPQMEPGYGYQELTYSHKGIHEPAMPHRDETPAFNVEIGSADPNKQVVMDPDQESYYKAYMPRSTSESALKLSGGYAPRKSSRSPPSSSAATPEVLARRDIIEKRPSHGYSPELPQTARSMEEMTVNRPTIEWNKHSGSRHEEAISQPTGSPSHRYSMSSDAGQTARMVKLNQRTTVPRPDDYWMRDLSSSSRGTSREDLLSSRDSNRKAWQEESQDSAYRSRSDSNSSSSRRSLHNLSATPKQKIISNQDWMLSDEAKRSQERRPSSSSKQSANPGNRHSEIMRQHVPNSSDHWLVEEAERRRHAEFGGQDRPSSVQNWNSKMSRKQAWRN